MFITQLAEFNDAHAKKIFVFIDSKANFKYLPRPYLRYHLVRLPSHPLGHLLPARGLGQPRSRLGVSIGWY